MHTIFICFFTALFTFFMPHSGNASTKAISTATPAEMQQILASPEYAIATEKQGEQFDKDIWYVTTFNKYPESLQLFIKAGANPNTTNDYYTPLLHVVANKRPAAFVEVLLKNGADIHALTPRGESALHFALNGDDTGIDTLTLLLDAGADINAPRNKNKETPLILAIFNNKSPEVISFMLQRGADKTAQDSSGKTAYDYAKTRAIYQQSDILQQLKP